MSQVKDDLSLMELMIEDGKKAESLYRPTHYWARFQDELVNELRTDGLEDFRNRKKSIMVRFGGVDIDPMHEFLYDTNDLILKPFQIITKIKLGINKFLRKTDQQMERYTIARNYGIKNNAKPIENLSTTKLGNPSEIFEVKGKLYNSLILNKYIEYAYCCKFINFDNINTIVELGPGGGKQVEVIKRLHPHICFYLFDIAPEQYVCEQYLSALFPNDVVSYRETREMQDLPTPEKGKIFIIGNWKISQLKNLKFDLFWNSGSLDETEYEVAQNYLSYPNTQAKYVYLKMSSKGVRHTVHPVKLDDCKNFLTNFKLVDKSVCILVPKILPFMSYRFAFWEKTK
ncbi:MAG: putative sugar O-methyltransferase [Thaumarchaeota archaeon]|nr:putative sugar O-methyltransferase [Nitrososphaerota archaeon]